jgi:hypothetical protein
VSIRAMILSLSRFNIVEPERAKILEKKWAAYREENGFNLYGQADSGEPRSRGCVDSDAQ